MLSTASDDDDDDADSDATTELDDGDAAQFAHIRRQEVTRLQVLPRICQLCQQQQQQQSTAVEEWFEFRGGQQRVLDRGQVEKGQLGTQVQLCQTEGSLKVVIGSGGS